MLNDLTVLVYTKTIIHLSVGASGGIHLYMVFLGIVCKIILKYSKKLLDYKVKNKKTYIIIRVTMSHSVLR